MPSKSLARPERVRLNRSLLKFPITLEKVVVRELVGMLKLLPFKSLKVHWMFSVCTSGETSEMVKVKVTLLSGTPTILPWTACTVGRTEGQGGGGEEEGRRRTGGGKKGEGGGVIIKGTTHDSSSAVSNVVCWWMRPEVQSVQVSGVGGLQCIWCCVVEGLLQYLVQ